ncbi:hypothetical protein DS901_11385 [Loktanella sp. D2R18]|uniref:DUF3618 domain-containing protein n=1 Tax=Rhodobacterales TaxID=204455 RepID=UPI000DE9523F|nr:MULTISPECIES: DUF3618 domain-containing protein [Rhodobacterales]MDO6590353.1 DUF3618 domain-containing protein [Yoonia sp. 1_MG-2023]RBW42846.1 hypothetical protein DS901_11385 [Loktanella sp. D2R18]
MPNLNTMTERVEQDRADLAATLDALSDAVAPQRIADQVSDATGQIGGDLAHKAWESVRQNPAGSLMTLIGLGLMASGPLSRPAPERAKGPVAVDPEEALIGFDARVAQADHEIRKDMTGQMSHRPKASKLRATLDKGLDHLPPKARKRVIQARKAASAAQEAVELQARRTAHKTKGAMQEQPLAVGAVALGFGLLVGTMLPGTRREDDLLGARRDALMDDARKVLEGELSKLQITAKSASREVAAGV